MPPSSLRKQRAMATQMMRAMGPSEDNRKPPPSLPSPTLTNPDMLLPEKPIGLPLSPPRHTWRDRPPSPSYLKDRRSESSLRSRSGSGGSAVTTAMGKKEKRGMMSRKMMLLRSRTASSGTDVQLNGNSTPVSRHGQYERFDGFDGAYASSPTLMDVGNLAPEQPEQRRASNATSSGGSDDMKGLPHFLAKYEASNTPENDDELESNPATQEYGYATSTYDETLDARRRQQEEDEYASAILSKRAEEILANAKKRLNVRSAAQTYAQQC